MQRFLRDQKGDEVVEFMLILFLVVIVAIAVLVIISGPSTGYDAPSAERVESAYNALHDNGENFLVIKGARYSSEEISSVLQKWIYENPTKEIVAMAGDSPRIIYYKNNSLR